MQKLMTCIAVAVVFVLVSCGGDDEATSGDPLADAFADQLVLDAGYSWFQGLDRAETECFVTTVLDTIGPQRLAELRFAPDNIPDLFEADWTDSEIDALAEIFASCVDNATGTEVYVLSLFGGQDRYSDCMVPEITSKLGDQFWLEQFRFGFNPPRTEMTRNEAARRAQEAGEEPAQPDFVSDIEALFETCIPDYPGEYAEDACGGEPCEDPPDPRNFRSVVLECSRDPFVDASFYASIDELDETLRFRINCEEQGRGTLITVRLAAYPCPQGPRDIELIAAGEPITEQAVTDACTNAP